MNLLGQFSTYSTVTIVDSKNLLANIVTFVHTSPQKLALDTISHSNHSSRKRMKQSKKRKVTFFGF